MPRIASKMVTFTIMGMFLVSASVRSFSEVGAANAQENFDMAEQAVTSKSQSRTSVVASIEDLDALLADLLEREERIKSEERALAVKEKKLEIAKAETARRISSLQKAEERLRSTIALAKTAAEDDISRLIEVYENMKPKEASALFQEMEPDFAAGFLSRMRPDIAAKILAGVEPQIAYSISAILAGRNANVPTE